VTDLISTLIRKGPPKPSDAVAKIGPNTTAHEMRDPFDIGDALSTLAQTGEPVTAYPGRREAVMLRIDSVDSERKVFTVDLADGVHLLDGKVTFVASLGGNAKIQFDIEQDWSALPGQPNLAQAPFPDGCQVLNRRAEQRLDTPLGVNFNARFTMMGRVFEMPLYDFSRGGVGLRATPEQAFELYVGKKLEGVALDLGPSLSLSADLEVRLLRPFRTFLLGQQVQVGCRISNITMQMKQSLERAVTTVKRRK
jgi:c-di-GMP-binding flagellar brake protein YcgR